VPNNEGLRTVTDRCPLCYPHWEAGKAPAGHKHVYLIRPYSGSNQVYVGTSASVEDRYHQHFVKGIPTFLPTFEELEALVLAEAPVPYYEVVRTVPELDGEHRRAEREVADSLAALGFEVSGGR
jgi:hypothetical protein